MIQLQILCKYLTLCLFDIFFKPVMSNGCQLWGAHTIPWSYHAFITWICLATHPCGFVCGCVCTAQKHNSCCQNDKIAIQFLPCFQMHNHTIRNLKSKTLWCAFPVPISAITCTYTQTDRHRQLHVSFNDCYRVWWQCKGVSMCFNCDVVQEYQTWNNDLTENKTSNKPTIACN